MVEMLVCFALRGMLMVSATIVIASAMNVYKQVKDASQAREVADLLCDKMESELARARREAPDIKDENHEVTYFDSKNRNARIYVDDKGQIQFAYGSGTDTSLWHFDPALYQGFEVKELKITKVIDPAHPAAAEADDVEWLDASVYSANIYKIELTLSHPDRYDSVTTRYVKCRCVAE